ncbi:MAG: PAS domain-containing protein [Cyanobacteria bacterium P01_D01_bin.105]
MADRLSKLPVDLFEQAIAHCASGLIICDAQQSGMPIVYASPSFEALTGYTSSEAIGQDCLFLQGDDTEQIGLDDIRAAFAKGTGCKVLLRNYHKSGRPFWNEVTLSPIHNEENTVTYYVGTQVDISHYLETFKALQESESRYQHLYEETPAMLHSVGADGCIVSVSHYWLEKLGYQRHEVVGRPIADFWAQPPEEQQPHVNAAPVTVPLSAAYRDVPCQFLKKGGDRIDALISSIDECAIGHSPSPSACCRALSVSVDITERKKVEETLRRNEALMRAINNLPPTGIFVMDAQTDEALFVNTEFYKIWQLEPLQAAVGRGEMTGEQLLSECLSYVNLSAFVAASTSEDFSGGIKIVEDEMPLLDGRTLRRIYGPIQENNVTFAYLYVFEDITARKEAVRQLAEATEAAEAANRAKSEFLANMSHELRSPLNAILGFAHILKESRPSPAQKEHLEIIYNSGNHLLALINDILDISKIEAGCVVLSESDFNLHQLLDELQQMFWNAAHTKGLTLEVNSSEDLPKVICSDRLKLRQILINLLSNAIKFTDAGSVTLTACLQGADAAQSQNQSPTLVFAVTDTGPGIRAEDQSRLFAAFVQTKSGLTSHEGTGLGLAISQEYVQLLGGNLQVVSAINQGATFSFEINVALSDHDSIETEPERKIVSLAPGQPDYRVLVVDDVSINRKLLTHLLSSVGFEVREAENGKEAIALWQAWQPHLIWMDMQMPVMTGEEAASQIRQRESQKITKLIALTASAFEENKVSALNSGCDDFLSKPVQAASVFRKMKQHLGVEYRYEDLTSSSNPEQLAAEESAAQATPLPLSELMAMASKDWQYRLTQATLDLDDNAILALAQQLPPTQQRLASAVQKCVETLSYKQLLQALQCQDTEAFSS